MKVRCDINGLDCPHCAAKLEGLLKQHAEIDEASINFPMKSLVLDVADDADEDHIVECAQKIANDMDDGIEINIRDQCCGCKRHLVLKLFGIAFGHISALQLRNDGRISCYRP